MSGKQRIKRLSGGADPDQFQRFLEAAQEHDCEENADRVDEVVRRAAKMPPPRQEPPKPKKGRKTDK